MIRKVLFYVFFMLMVSLSSEAKPRTYKEMVSAASTVLRGGTSVMRRAAATPLKVLRSTDTYSIFGNEQGGFVVVSTDDIFPAVIGYSERKLEEELPDGFRWWLNAANEVMESDLKFNAPRRAPIVPDPTKYAPQMPALVSSQWGQEEPYNNKCPYGPDLYGTIGRAITGCVATAMAQIMYYHRTPLHGIGSHYVYYPSQNPSGVKVTANFGAATYDWGNMLDTYENGYTSEQAEAVALLMLHCGVASEMQYGVSFSGTYTEHAVEGFKKYFGYTNTRIEQRDKYKLEDNRWMDLVYTELSNRRPILYTGIDLSDNGGGHAFVIDGYDANGLVHVNWGWCGKSDGYYDISLLNPQHGDYSYKFSEEQDMAVGISMTGNFEAICDTFDVVVPGTLSTLIPESKKYCYTALKVNGNINSSDMRFLRDMIGRDEYGRGTRGALTHLNLTDARIVAGGEPFLYDNGVIYTTDDDRLPDKAFFKCERLEQIQLPTGLRSVGEAPFALCASLDSVAIVGAADKQFIYADGVVYNKDQTELITCFPFYKGSLEVKSGTKRLHNSALSGCIRLRKLSLPASLEELGDSALYYCYALSEIKCYPTTAPIVGNDVFFGIDKSATKLFVRYGYSESYKVADEWKDFFATMGAVTEFGALIKGGTNIRKYGEPNPEKYRYKTIVYGGHSFKGEPAFYCEATQTSAPGRYPVVITRGTIEDEAVEFENGVLIVQDDPSAVSEINIEVYPADVFSIGGTCVRKAATTLDGLPHGVYIVKGRKIVI